jgi:hypothetical protein
VTAALAHELKSIGLQQGANFAAGHSPQLRQS